MRSTAVGSNAEHKPHRLSNRPRDVGTDLLQQQLRGQHEAVLGNFRL